MKKLIAVVLAVSLVLTLGIGSGMALAEKPEKAINQGNGLPSGPHYNLNIIGKKADWNNKDGFNNPDRHTIFVPENTDGFSYMDPTDVLVQDTIKVEISQDKSLDDIAVIDGTAFDGDGTVAIALPDKKYNVFICSKAKPGGTTDITAKVYYDATTGYYLIDIGDVSVTRKWATADDLFYVDPSEDTIGAGFDGVGITTTMWIFDYLEYLAGLEPGDQDSEYYWDFDNNGNKLVKLRFYEK